MLARRAVIIVALTLAAIAIHEFGHYVVYSVGGCRVAISLQSVRPVGPVAPGLDHWAKLAGPILSLVAGGLCLVAARRHASFAWATASLANSSLRLFPLVMDVVRALKGAPAFSDEGDVALALLPGVAGRLGLLAVPIALSLLLTILAGREYHFRGRVALKVAAIYLFTLMVGIAVVIMDELLR